jgi:hypothetical protein
MQLTVTHHFGEKKKIPYLSETEVTIFLSRYVLKLLHTQYNHDTSQQIQETFPSP